jgi:1-acyl-sn-glycerol-3-phosphate acyltransferase
MLRPIQICLFFLLLLWLATSLLAGNLACIPLVLIPSRLRHPLMQRIISMYLWLFMWIGERIGIWELDLKDLDKLNRENRLILVANHPSMIDVFLVLSRVRNLICLMKASIQSNMFLGVGAYLAGYISNQRVDHALRSAIDSVRSGGLLLTFPEGTRTTRQPVNPIKPGFALIAKESNAPIQTILIWTNSEYLGKGWKIWRPPQFPMVYKAILGERMYFSNSYTKTADQLQSYFERTLHRSVDPDIQVTM